MKLGCWPVVQTHLALDDLEFTYSNGCFENMKSYYTGYRMVAYNLNDLNHSEKTEAKVKEIIKLYNEAFGSNVVFHKIDKVTPSSYASYLHFKCGGDILAYVNGRDFRPVEANQFCYFSISAIHNTINYYNFNILRMLFSSDFSMLFDNFFKLLGTLPIEPFELLQICHFCQQGTFGTDKNLLIHTDRETSKITPINTFYRRMEHNEKLYACMYKIQIPRSEFVELFKDGEYMKIYERLK